MPRKILFIFFILPFLIFSQTKYSFPLDTVDITGNFGEIRNNHFHQGIDFSTKGIENYPVKSIDDGYVYRLKISSDGYGKAIYIHHPSGFLSVYAHLNQFSQKIQSLIENYQIKNHLNELDIQLPADSIQVKKEEIIGFSGNTGASSGPHLHFEIRDELTEIPINPLFYFNVQDTVPPVLQDIFFFDLSDTINPRLIKQNTLSKDTVYIPSISGLGIVVYDKMYSDGNPNNVYEVQVFLDSIKIYQHQLRYITFDNTIYVKYFSEKNKHQIIQKCFATHLYPPDFYDTLVHKGRIILHDTNVHVLQINLYDEQHHLTSQKILVKTKQIKPYKNISIKHLLKCTKSNTLQSKYYKIIIPEKSLYHDINARFSYDEKKKIINYTGNALPLRYPAQIHIHHTMSEHRLSKILLKCGNKYYVPDTITSKALIFSVKVLDDYRLYTDTKKPIIKPLHYNKKTNTIQSINHQVQFFVQDNTQIKDYKVFFNQQFCISYYDKKNNIITAHLPKEYIYADTNTIQIIVTDIANNTTVKVVQY